MDKEQLFSEGHGLPRVTQLRTPAEPPSLTHFVLSLLSFTYTSNSYRTPYVREHMPPLIESLSGILGPFHRGENRFREGRRLAQDHSMNQWW